MIAISILKMLDFNNSEIYYWKDIQVTPKELVELINRCETISICRLTK